MAELKLEHTKNLLIEWGERKVNLMQQELRDTDNLKNSLEVLVEETDSGYDLSIVMPEYAQYVDSGRKPGSKMPPINVIKEWARRKNIQTFKDNRGKDISEDSRAFLIARSIGRDGIPPKPFIHLLFTEMDKLKELLGSAFAMDVVVNLQALFEEKGINVEKTNK